MNSVVKSAGVMKGKRRLQMTNRVPKNRQSGVTTDIEAGMLCKNSSRHYCVIVKMSDIYKTIHKVLRYFSKL